MDSLGCAMLAMKFPGASSTSARWCPAPRRPAARVPARTQLDPVQAAYNIGVQVRWLDFNDTWLAAGGAIRPTTSAPSRRGRLAVAPQRGRGTRRHDRARCPHRGDQGARDQGGYALKNSFNRVGLDHVIPWCAWLHGRGHRLLGGGREEIINAVSHSAGSTTACCAPIAMRPTPGRAKSWAAGDACRRAVTRPQRGEGLRGLSLGPERQDLGLLRCRLPGQDLPSSSGPSAAT